MNDIVMFDLLSAKLRAFFRDQKGFVEVPAQPRLSILAACEDPKTISQFVFSGTNWPLPQTGQMQLEVELLSNPHLKGVFCATTSYRNEPFPIPGRHDKIFPMFEFESHGSMEDMKKLEEELLLHLGFGSPTRILYDDACKKYGADILESNHEEKMQEDLGIAVSLEKFPRRTDPFWNMKRDERENGLYNKVDIILYGMETIGSAERSTNIDEMRNDFLTISNGDYAKLLYNQFGEHRVRTELDKFLSYAMIPRFGGGIGMTRLARAYRMRHF